MAAPSIAEKNKNVPDKHEWASPKPVRSSTAERISPGVSDCDDYRANVPEEFTFDNGGPDQTIPDEEIHQSISDINRRYPNDSDSRS